MHKLEYELSYLEDNLDELILDPQIKEYIRQYFKMYEQENIDYIKQLNQICSESKEHNLEELDKLYMEPIRKKGV